MYRLILPVVLFMVAGFAVYADNAILTAPDYADPGEVIQVSVLGKLLDDVSVSLIRDRGHAVSRSEGFLWSSPGGHKVNVALLGIPVESPPGQYTIILQAQEGPAHWNLEKTITIRSQAYPKNIIQFDEEVSNLYTNNSELKKQEARILWDVLSRSNPDALYHFGLFVPPVDKGVVTSEFGERRLYRLFDGFETSSVHKGQDIWDTLGTPVSAVGKGRVVMAVERYLTGNTVVIEHLPGVYTVYYHLDSISARQGEIVAQGAVIGTLGRSGLATGEHLHWELRIGGIPVLPIQIIHHPLLDINSLYP